MTEYPGQASIQYMLYVLLFYFNHKRNYSSFGNTIQIAYILRIKRVGFTSQWVHQAVRYQCTRLVRTALVRIKQRLNWCSDVSEVLSCIYLKI